MRIEEKERPRRTHYDAHTLRRIYLRTDGCCFICRRKLNFRYYASPGLEGAWEVERLFSLDEGGTDHPNNLLPACTSCSLEHGAARPPYFGTNTGAL